MNPHLEDLLKRHPRLEACADSIQQAFESLQSVFRNGGKVLLCGNGGSSADAEHWSAELLKSFSRPRPLNKMQQEGLPAGLAEGLQQALPAIPLTGFVSLKSAFANDADARYVYAQLVWALGGKGDAFVGLSTSGNAVNVCAAAETARAKGLACIALTGQEGGRLKTLADVCISVPETSTHLVQELHLPVYHCLAVMLEDAFFQDA